MITKDHSIPRKTNTSELLLSFVHLAKLLQKIIASQKNQHIRIDTIFCNHLAKLLQKIIASQKTNTSHHSCDYLLYSSCKVVTKDHSIPENKHIASQHVATNFCNHLCKIVAKDSSIPRKPTHRINMLLLSFVTTLQDDYKRS